MNKEKISSNWNIFLKNFKKYCEILRETLSENIKAQKICNNDYKKTLINTKTYEIAYEDSSDCDDSFNNSFNDISCDGVQSKISGMTIKYFLDENFYFQWLEKTFSNIPFMYAFQKKKTILIKINEDNYMTLCRSANRFTSDEQTRIEFYCDLNKGGKMEIGIGRDEAGNENTLCSDENICISTEGIYKGRALLNFTRIEDKDIIIFDIFIKASIKDSLIPIYDYMIRISKNNKNLIELNINKEDYFVFAGFNRIGNSVQVRDFRNITTNVSNQIKSFSHRLVNNIN